MAFAARGSAEKFDHQDEHVGRGGENYSADDDENCDNGGGHQWLLVLVTNMRWTCKDKNLNDDVCGNQNDEDDDIRE